MGFAYAYGTSQKNGLAFGDIRSYFRDNIFPPKYDIIEARDHRAFYIYYRTGRFRLYREHFRYLFDERMTDINALDVLVDARRALRGQIAAIDGKVREFENSKLLIDKFARRFRPKRGKIDRIGPSFAARLADIDRAVAGAECDLARIERAIEILDEHEFERNAPSPRPVMSIGVNIT